MKNPLNLETMLIPAAGAALGAGATMLRWYGPEMTGTDYLVNTITALVGGIAAADIGYHVDKHRLAALSSGASGAVCAGIGALSGGIAFNYLQGPSIVGAIGLGAVGALFGCVSGSVLQHLGFVTRRSVINGLAATAIGAAGALGASYVKDSSIITSLSTTPAAIVSSQ